MACPSYPALSAMEEQLIALVLPVVKIVHLRGGQLGYTGSCVAVRQDITRGAQASESSTPMRHSRGHKTSSLILLDRTRPRSFESGDRLFRIGCVG